jgi:hypothetical protein
MLYNPQVCLILDLILVQAKLFAFNADFDYFEESYFDANLNNFKMFDMSVTAYTNSPALCTCDIIC